MNDEVRAELRTWAGLILVVGGLVWLLFGWFWYTGDYLSQWQGLLGIALIIAVCAGGLLVLQNPGLFAPVRILGYVVVIAVGSFLTLLVTALYYDERCGGYECDLELLKAMFWGAGAFAALVVVCVLVEMARRERSRRATRLHGNAPD